MVIKRSQNILFDHYTELQNILHTLYQEVILLPDSIKHQSFTEEEWLLIDF